MRLLLTALLAFATGGAVVASLVAPISPDATMGTVHAGSIADGGATPVAETDETAAPPDSRWPADAPSPEQVMYEQPKLMRQALAALTPRVPGVPNLYLVTFAGDGDEDVFRNEAEYAARLFRDRYGKRTHVIVLENNPATLSTQPLASWSNLETALDGVAAAMDPSQDILMVYFTSHGSPDHDLLVDMDPLPLDQINAADLPGILDEHRFKWKVVVVNACYSGGFIPPLRGDGTLVLTAARSDRSSFGCGSDSDITYFGRAWLVDALARTPDLVDAFTEARAEIARWEKHDKLTPSEPQIAAGAGIEKQLAKWRHGLTIGPAPGFGPGAQRTATTGWPAAAPPNTSP